MGIAILTLDHLMTRLGGAVEALLSRGSRITPPTASTAPAAGRRADHAEPARATHRPGVDPAASFVPSRAGAALPAIAPAAVSRPPASMCRAQAVRVVHISDGKTDRRCHGRFVISGRMADVCAELGRLAAQESLAH